MDQENYFEIISRYLDGSATEEEARLLLDWLKADRANVKLFSNLKDIWIRTGILNVSDAETEAALIRFKTKVQSSKKPKLTKKYRLLIYGNVAALFIIVLLTGLLIFKHNRLAEFPLVYNETIVPVGQKGQVVLSDGTKIILNSDSRLRYPSSFNNNTREIYLEGEAYFDVAHDRSKPFLVHSGKLTVRVLGTSFNLKSYPTDRSIETTLVTGSVKIFTREGGKQREITTLSPLQQAVYNVDNKNIIVNNLTSLAAKTEKQEKKQELTKEPVSVKIESVISWKEKKLIFDNETLDQMAQKLTRWYGKTVHINSENLKNNRYSGKFIYNETIYQVLEALSLTTDLSYYEDNHEIYISSK